jgi:hypothetical protein
MNRSLALAALMAAALGVSAWASPAGVHNRPRGIYNRAPGELHTTFTAVVAANGTLKRGIGAVLAAQPEGKGTYVVSFNTNISSCAYVVTIGETDSNGSQDAAVATVVGRSGDDHGVFIDIYDANGAEKNAPFHLDVGC